MAALNTQGFVFLLSFFLVTTTALAGPEKRHKVEMNSYVIDVKDTAAAAVQRPKKKGKHRHEKWIVQFNGPVRPADKKQLKNLGCRIFDYVPEFAFIVAMDDELKEQVANLPGINGVVRYRPEYKIERRTGKKVKERIGRAAKEKFHVRVDGAENLATLLATVHRNKGEVLYVGRDVATITIPSQMAGRLADLEEVLWIEEAVDLVLFNDISRWTIQTYIPEDIKIWDRGILGQGQIVGIGDTGLDYDMPWFRDPDGIAIGPLHRKVVGYMAYEDDYDGDYGHGTHVAGTVAGDRTPVDGLSLANGMAPRARLFIQDITPGEQPYVYPPTDLGEMFEPAYGAGAFLHSNSWGRATNVYENYARSTDRFMWEHKDFLALFANGNSGDREGTVGAPATAKNVVSVGATENGYSAEHIAGFSSNGPTADGRIKPTVTAPGVAVVSADSDGTKESFNSDTIAYSGTSMATPTVAGAAALVRQYYMDGYWPFGSASPAAGFAPSAALIKATLINSAQNMSGDFTDAPIPSSGQGWGRINLANTLHFFRDDNFLDIADVTTGLATGAVWSQRYFSTGDQTLKVTLVWTDYPGIEGAAKALVNDLDLQVAAPDSTMYMGNVFQNGESVAGGSADRLNVEEQVLIPTYQSGDYTVTVSGYNVPFGPQPFAVVVSGAVSITARGFIDLDKTRYNDAGTIQIQVADLDLDFDSSAAEEIFITIASTSEPGGETVRLVENGTSTAIFIGAIDTRLGPADPEPNGYLEIMEGDTITATYHDMDDGTGIPVTVTATASADLAPPQVSKVTVGGIDQDRATISWTTDEPVSAGVFYGETPARLDGYQSDPWLMTSPTVTLGNLKEAVTYFFTVSSIDEAGNESLDDNNGDPYSFSTLNLPPTLSLYSSNSLETYQDETVLFGTAIDPSGIESVWIRGEQLDQEVLWRQSDGYYELTVALALGENSFTVQATDTLGNSQATVITITRLQPPDLTITSLAGPIDGGWSEPIHVENTICNHGEGIAPGSGMVGWYLSADTVVSPDEDIAIGFYNSEDGIPPDACITVPIEIRLTIPLGLVGNTYYLAAMVDSNGDIEEADETNNTLTGNRMTVQGSDLVMTAVSAPQKVGSGGSFTVFNTVQNSGLGASPGFDVVVYLSPDPEITRNDIELGYRYVSPLEPVGTPYPYPSESSAETEVSVKSSVPAGTYYIGVIADPWNAVKESDKTNNVLTGNRIEVGTVDSEPPNVPENLAGIAVSESQVDLYWDAAIDTGGSGLAGYRIFRDGVAVGNSASTNYADSGLAANFAYSYKVSAYDYADNESAHSTGITVTTMAGDSEAPTVPGNLAVTAVSASQIDLHWEAAFDTGGSGLAGYRIFRDGVEVGASATTSFADNGLAADTEYSYSVCAYDKAGNESVPSPPVVVKTLSDGASKPSDLVISALNGPTAGGWSEPIHIDSTVCNRGESIAPGSGVIGCYLSIDTGVSPDDDIALDFFNYTDDIPPGACITVPIDIRLTIPLGLVGNTYYLAAVVDSNGNIEEADETNNTLAGNQMTIQGPDLVMTEVSAPQRVEAESSFIVPNTVQNSGLGASPGFDVVVYLSPDPEITRNDIELGSRYVSPLEPVGTPYPYPSESSDETEVFVKDTVPAGTYYIGVIADPWNAVRESDKTNNALAGNRIEVGMSGGEPTGKMESGSVMVNGDHLTVALQNTYSNPVVVCSIQYANNSVPVVSRVSNVTSASFEVRLQNPSGNSVVPERVSYLVVEEGVWTIDGVNVEAQTYLSTITAENNSWGGEFQGYGHTYTNPVVVGQVMTENDSNWSVFWSRGSRRYNPPSASVLYTGKTVCEDDNTSRADEIVGFIVFEAGHTTVNGVEFEAFLGADTVKGVDNSPPYTYNFHSAFQAAPLVAITSMAGVDGGNGGWAYVYGSTPASNTSLYLAIDEDQVGDGERSHTKEQVGYVVFASPMVYP
jgi:chitodextrinase